MVGSSCLAREASDPMFAKLQLHLLLQLVQHLHLLQTLLPGHTGLAAVFQHWFHWVELWREMLKGDSCRLVLTHCVGSPLQRGHSWPPSGRSVGPHFVPAAHCPKPCLNHGLLIKQKLYKIRQTKNVLRTSLTDPEQNHKSCLASITSAPSQHLGKLPDILGKSWPSIIDISARERKLTNTHSEPDVWYVTAHVSTLCADEQPEVISLQPGIRK